MSARDRNEYNQFRRGKPEKKSIPATGPSNLGNPFGNPMGPLVPPAINMGNMPMNMANMPNMGNMGNMPNMGNMNMNMGNMNMQNMGNMSRQPPPNTYMQQPYYPKS